MARQLGCGQVPPRLLLTPKIGTWERLICGPNLVTNPVQRGKISSEDSAETLAVGSFASVRQRDCLRWFREIAWWRGPSGRNKWMDKHSHLGIKLGIKYCARSPPGVMSGQGINMNPRCM
jgi:hypothetical protein